MKADITDRQAINSLLANLSDHSQARWGLMKPQNMVEHLTKTLGFSNGKLAIPQRTTAEEGLRAKEALLYTDMEMPRGLKSAVAGETADPFELESLDAAKAHLNRELDDFEACFAANPEAIFVHPRLGPLHYREWIILHNKHFTHHFKQFGLI